MHDPRRAVTFVIAVVCALAAAGTAQAFSSGITTLSFDENGLGCGECHAGGSVPVVTVTGPTSVAPDSTNEYTVTVEDVGSQDHAGFNVSALLGVLATGGSNATNTEVDPGTGGRDEVTHSAPKAASGGVTTFSFLWTAPSSFTSVSLDVWGNAVNFNGFTSGDAPNFDSIDVVNNTIPTPTATPTATPEPIDCGATPQSGCRTPTISEKAFFMLKDNAVDDGKDRLVWKWLKGATTTKAEYANPVTSNNYKLCVYDGAGFAMSAAADAGGICAGKPCWADKTTSFKYKDKDLTPDGTLSVLLKEGLIDGKAKIIFKGKGVNLGMPPDLSALTSPITVQLRKGGTSLCWEAVYSFPPALKNDAEIFKDKAD